MLYGINYLELEYSIRYIYCKVIVKIIYIFKQV